MELLHKQLKEQIVQAVMRTYPDLHANPNDLVEVAYPPPHFDADYASSVPLRLAKPLKKDPKNIADELTEELKAVQFIKDTFSNVSVHNGFINFTLASDRLHLLANALLKKGSEPFLAHAAAKPSWILNEFISANPTGPLTMGNARGAFLGDILSRILRKVGHNVENEYYINNASASKQIQEIGRTFLGKSESYLTPWLEGMMQVVRKENEEIPQDPAEAGSLLARSIQEHNKDFVESKLNIRYANWFGEEKLYSEGYVDRAMNVLREKGLVYENEGATWMQTTKYGDDEDRVLIRSNGEPTYFLADIAYHMQKYERGYDLMIDIWGADHQGHVKRLYAALDALGRDKSKLKIIVTQLVRLLENGEMAKMSKRAGMYVTLEELVDEVGLDVARFFFLMRSPDTHIDFDLALAKERSEKNPVYYTQYAYVRAYSILHKAGWRKWFAWSLPRGYELEEAERALLMRLLQFPELIYDISQTFAAHQLTTYAADLARDFHTFYEKCPVVSAKSAQARRARIVLCRLTLRIMGELFDVMGISKPKEM